MLEIIQNTAATCKFCELNITRRVPVFAKGNPNSDIMIVGMCPGPDENEIGIPFVGKAGEILDAILEASYGPMDNYEGVYITNLVKCFVPPGTELQQQWMVKCLAYFVAQVGIVNPKVIITLGKDVSNFLLDNKEPMGYLRGKAHTYMKRKLVSTYHPSYLARGGGVKHKHFNIVVDDFKFAKESI